MDPLSKNRSLQENYPRFAEVLPYADVILTRVGNKQLITEYQLPFPSCHCPARSRLRFVLLKEGRPHASLRHPMYAPSPSGLRQIAWLALAILIGGGLASGKVQAQNDASPVPVIRAMAFGDVGYVTTQRDTTDGFLLGQLIGHLNAGLTNRLSFFGEVSATGRPDGYGVEVERLLLRYDFLDRFKLSVGRYHTPISYWNVSYHHGLWLQTTAARPEMIRFGSKLLPIHFVGLLAEGNLYLSPLGLSYELGIGNGRHSDIARGGDAGDVNDHRAWLASLYARPPALYGLQVGASAYLDRVLPDVGTEAREQIYSAHLVWNRGAPEVIAEYSLLRHEPIMQNAPTHTSRAYYVQAAYKLPNHLSGFTPYLRSEHIAVPDTDPFLGSLELGYDALVTGIRYDFAPYAALKAEYRRERFGGEKRSHGAFFQVSFVVPNLTGASD